jgi:hypothetical protein
MIKKLLSVFFLLFISIFSFAESFDITNYFIDIKMNANGSMLITETIDVHFKEQRHGIIRSIPFRYTQYDFPGSEKAERASNTAAYELIVKDIKVSGFEFSTSYEGDFLKLKIGSADKYVDGDQKFVISYIVWGGLNEFSDRTELYWNLLGHKWDCNIAKASFKISFPKAVNLKENDVLLFTGSEGSKYKDAKFVLTSNSITGSLTKPLKANEGMTIAVRFTLSTFTSTGIPVEDLAKRFYINKYLVLAKINSDASIDLEEKYFVTLLYPQSSFMRDFYTLRINDSLNIKDHIIKDIKVNYESPGLKDAVYNSKNEGEAKFISLYSSTGSFRNKIEVTLKYKVWGAVSFKNGKAEINWPFTGEMLGEPFKGFEAVISADSMINIEKMSYSFYKGTNNKRAFPTVNFDINKKSFSIKYNKVFATDAIYLKASLSDKGFNKSKMPLEINSKKYYIKDFLTELKINKNGSIHVKHIYYVKFKNPASADNSFTARENFYYSELYSLYGDLKLNLPDWSLFGNYTKLTIDNMNITGKNDYYMSEYYYMDSIRWNSASEGRSDSVYTYEYDIFGLLMSKDGKYYLNQPMISNFSEPVKTGTIKIIFPDGVEISGIKASILLNNDKSKQLNCITDKNSLIWKLNEPILNEETPVLEIYIPKDSFSVSAMLTCEIIWSNNKMLFYPIILFIILLILWYFIGRDKKGSIVVQYKPPIDITPAEAGYLWDNKLHKRDLVSLIYYWAGKGLLTIKEIKTIGIADNDYELTKLKELPAYSKSFEITIFNGIFKSGNSGPVKVSSLKSTFFYTMNIANKELRTFSKTHQFFVPGTLGFGIFLRVIAFFVLGIGLFTILVNEANWLQQIICYVSSAAIIFYSGK